MLFRSPTGPPYTAFCGNLSFDATEGGLTDFFGGSTVVNSVRLVRDPMDQKLKGFGYIEFTSLDALKAGLALSGTNYDGRPVRVNVADNKPQGQGAGGFGDRGGRSIDPDEGRSMMGPWERRGPLADLPGSGRSGPPRREFENARDEPRQGGFGAMDSGEPREWGAARGSKFVASSEPPERGSRFGSSRVSSGTSTPYSPVGGSDDGNGPPGPARGEMASTWRRATPESTAPPSPTTRRPLQLAARSVSTTSASGSEGTATSATSTSAAPSKPSPFGAARPVDTAAKERELLAEKPAPAQPARSFSTASQRSESGGGRPRVDPFGAAKPVDTAQKEREIEEKLAKAKLSSPAPAAASTAATTATDDAPSSPAAAAAPAGKTVPAAPKQNPWRKASVTEPNGKPTAAEAQVEADAATSDAPAPEATSEAEPAREPEATV